MLFRTHSRPSTIAGLCTLCFVSATAGAADTALLTDTADPGLEILINEIYADPVTSNDANCDGLFDNKDDEFVEIVNIGSVVANLSGGSIEDKDATRHTFAPGTLLAPGDTIVVFGGGSPTFDGTSPNPGAWCVKLPGNVITTVASTGSLELGDGGGGDEVHVLLAGGLELDFYDYDGEGDDEVSIGRDPDLTAGVAMVQHNLIPGSGGAIAFSPGQRVDLSPITPLPDTGDTGLDCPLPTTFFRDADGDGFGNLADPTLACELPAGYVVDFTDCYDDPVDGADVFPGAPQICDGLANTCGSPLPDDEIDDDGDGFVECTFDPIWRGVPAVVGDQDCDDTSGHAADVHPGAFEECDGIINDCDTGSLPSNELDDDGDGYVECTLPGGLGGWLGTFVPLGGDDCQDTGAHAEVRYPTADELCDGLLNDCDEAGGVPFDEVDDDADGFVECPIDAGGWRDLATLPDGGGDCDDSGGGIITFPGAPEVCDGFANDCDAVAVPDDEADDDGDGFVECSPWFGSPALDGGDCDDTSADAAAVFPGAPERCDGLQNDCDAAGLPATEIDNDGDGYVECAPIDAGGWDGAFTPLGGGDCDDTGPDADTIFPSAPEICDGLANDCAVHPVVPTDETDDDGDGYVECAIDPSGYDGPGGVIGGGDCQDTGPGAAEVGPGADELCDGLINSCGGVLAANETDDDGDGFVECTIDVGGWFGDGGVVGGDDCDDLSGHADSVFPGASEVCDGVINDCDTGVLPGNEVDNDGDGYVECSVGGGGGWHSAPVPSGGNDCEDASADADTIHPGAPELCDGLLNDCDTGSLPAIEIDDDGDGFVECAIDVSGWDGVPADASGGDCDDTSGNAAFVFPGAPEACDGIINDCDTGALPSNEADDDEDDHVACDLDAGPGWRAGPAPSGGLDCDDDEPTVFGGAAELCDGQLNDCLDSLPPQEVDNDGDGYVECPIDAGGWDGADPPVGGDDCDDVSVDAATVYVGAPERCDGIINDCDTASLPLDEIDNDTDGYVECTLDPTGWDGAGSPLGDDCDDVDPTVFPDAPEICDGIVNACGTLLPEDEDDDDGDGRVECAVFGPWVGDVSVVDGGDCDDGEPTKYTGAPELCDGIINDCDTGSLPLNEIDNDTDGYVECRIDAGGWDGVSAPEGGRDCDDTGPDAVTKFPGAPELCDGIINDCDAGSLDSEEIDDDGDGFVECLIDAGGWDGAGSPGGEDCDDTDPSIKPSAGELCDGQINDCLAISLDSLEIDDDGDGYVDCSVDAGGWDGVAILGGDDCDDLEPTVFLGALEVCDGQINDCDTGVMPADEVDNDTDGYVECTFDAGGWDGTLAVVGGDDCDDVDPLQHPGADERCDGQANDCALVVPAAEVDDDGDGYVDCAVELPWAGPPIDGGDDCDDTDPTRAPGFPELCDGQYNNCSVPVIPSNEVDNDGDDYVECNVDAGGWDGGVAITGGRDCDDTDPTSHPDAIELCDGQINDCKARVEQADPFLGLDASEVDDDGDEYVDCTVDAGGWDGVPIVGGDDCVDDDPTVHPDGDELCDGIDNQCDGFPVDAEIDDDGDGYVECTIDAGGWDGPAIVGGDDCDDDLTDDADTIWPDAPELCDGIINDCNTGSLPGNEIDNDGDGYVECAIDAGGWDGGDVPVGGQDCDDAAPHGPTVFPAAPELCDGIINDCDAGALDVREVDNDGDGFVECTFDGGGWDGEVAVIGGDDCDDVTPKAFAVYPGADELCDGIINDCTTETLPSNESDDDGDSHVECAPRDGWVGDPSIVDGQDCDDSEPTIYQGAPFLCDGLKNDCDDAGVHPDEIDDDGDFYVECDFDVPVWRDGFMIGGNDCNDTDPTIFPTASELCDGILNDCDGSIPPRETDNDGDDHVECTIDFGGWDGPFPGMLGDDCDDADPTVYPLADELCDGIINDCAVRFDPADPFVPLASNEVDDDGDGFVECTEDFGGWHGVLISGGDDCDDVDPTIFPGALELCDGQFNNCEFPVLPAVEIDDDGDRFVECDIDAGGWDGVFIIGGGDCMDDNPDVYPAAAELCDGLDNQCEEAGSAFDKLDPSERDEDEDGYVACTYDVEFHDVPGRPGIISDGDCDDGREWVHPTADPVCDGLDNDCDGAKEDNEIDHDGDLYVECDLIPALGWLGVPPGVLGGDCNPLEPTTNPSAKDVCGDGIDNNCNERGDHADVSALGYLDDDGDGLLWETEEYSLGTSDCDLDSDADGVRDDDEVRLGIDPADPDHDGDNVLDGEEVGPDPFAPIDTDGDGRINANDDDDDDDTIPSVFENYNLTDYPGDDDSDFDLLPDYLDEEDDGDQILTKNELLFGTDHLYTDSDFDGIPDGTEWCNWLLFDVADPSVCNINGFARPSDEVDCDFSVDVDGEVVNNCSDLGGGVTGDSQENPWDRDGDTRINANDPDDDGDDLSTLPREEQDDGECIGDDDGVPAYLDYDTDGDLLTDLEEGSGDEDGDFLENFKDCDSEGCEGDSDRDTIPNCIENELFGDPSSQNDPDWDKDGIDDGKEVGSDPNCTNPLATVPCVPQDTDGQDPPDILDTDDDGDGFPTIEEITEEGVCTDGIPEVRRAGDTNILVCSSDGSEITPRNTDEDVSEVYPVFPDDIPDYLDPDDDGDGKLSVDEGAGDVDGDGIPNWLDMNDVGGPDADADLDGISNEEEIAFGTDPYNPDSDHDDVDDGIEYGDGLPPDSDSDGVINPLDDDDDNDQIDTVIEGAFDADGDGTPNYLDLDSDGDGNIDANEKLDDVDCDGIVNFLDPDDTNGPCQQDTGFSTTSKITNQGCEGCSSQGGLGGGLWAGLLALALVRRRRQAA
jgi:hypothetical protein